MTDLVFSVSFTGTPDDYDKRGATMIVENENSRRAADVDENGDPLLPPLPYSTGAELKASYSSLLEIIVTKAHDSYVKQASEAQPTVKELWRDATDAQRAAALTALGG